MHYWNGRDIRLDRAATWDRLRETYRPRPPERYNLGTDLAHSGWVHATSRVALIEPRSDGRDAASTKWTFWELDRLTNRLGNALRASGIGVGDRVAVWLPQSVELAIAHLAIFKIGAISVPMFTNFGRDAVVHRISDSAARGVVLAASKVEEFAASSGIESVELMLAVGGDGGPLPTGAQDFWATLAAGSAELAAHDTHREDPAFLCYTSGTTGPSKGALHAHRVLFGHLPGISLGNDLAPLPGDVMWTPADWGWMGGIFDVLFPALHWGVPVLVHPSTRFDPEQALALIARHGVSNAFIPPTALRMMKAAGPVKEPELQLRTVCSGGESLGADTHAWAREQLGASINEFYGQTECNVFVSNCAALGVQQAGSIGKPVPGTDVVLADAEGNPVPEGENGEVCVRAPNLVMMLEYWNNPNATGEKIADGLLHTGDMAHRDEEGFLHFVGRTDDLISSAGYRIGPSDIENAIHAHPSVARAAAIGVPDELRGEVVAAVVVLNEGADGSDEVVTEIQQLVKDRVGRYAYPREVQFVDELPMTSTGKVQRAKLREAHAERG